jgi:hypothetical protein
VGVYGTAPTTGTVGIATGSGGYTTGVYGQSSAYGGNGVFGYSIGSAGNGVLGEIGGTSGTGVQGAAVGGTGATSGVFGQSSSNAGTGVNGWATAPGGVTYGVQGTTFSPQGFGVYGTAATTATAGIAYPSASGGVGVYGEALGTSGIGVYGNGLSTGVYGNGFDGVYGLTTASTGNGVLGVANGGANAYGVWGSSSSGYAGYFSGKVQIDGNLSATGVKSFKIDNPLDPANQYLYHYAVESPQVQNLYDGNVVLDAQGEAVVQLPDYFSAVNTGDYRYSLTPIGAPMPNLYVAEEIQGNTFKIAGGVAGKKVSWTVYGQRNDPWLRDHPQPDVAPKPAGEAGTYLYPQGYGQAASLAVDSARQQQLQDQAAGSAPASEVQP